MASETAPPPQPPTAPRSSSQSAEYDALIDRRLRSTCRQVKGVDLASGILTLAVVVLGYLFAATIVDHWVFSGGLGFLGRLVLFLGLVSLTGTLLARGLLPPLIYRINPIFAAQTVEQVRPSLKNGLVNLLFLRAERARAPEDPLSRRVYQGLQQSTATEISRVSAETVVDRSHLIRLGYTLAGILAVAALYLVFSPKNPLTSFGRIAAPWAKIAPPTRVTIEDVKPEDAVQYRGQTLLVSAKLGGLGADEEVLLYYTTTDGQSVDQAIPMRLPEGKYRHECQLPPGKLGLQQDLRYYLAAGDCRTPDYSVEVLAVPTILVDSVRFEYPPYTGMEPREQPGGDIRDLEGTRVIIRATANDQIARAAIEMDCDPRKPIRMTASGSRATGEFTLALNPDDPDRTEYRSAYQLRFVEATSGKNRENPEPIRHRIEVVADRAPEIRFIDPPPEDSQLPVNATLTLKILAEDPDFALRRVALRAQCEGRSLLIGPLVDVPKPQPGREGPVETAYSFQPTKLGLEPNDRVIYWAEAYDNKEPVHNRSQTARRSITITDDDGTPSAEKNQQADDGRSGQPQVDDATPPGQDADNPSQDPSQSDSADQEQEGMENQGQQKDSPTEQQEGDDSPRQEGPPNGQQQGEQQEQPAGGSDQPGMESGQQPGQEGDQSQSGGAGQEAQPTEEGANADPSQGAQAGDSPSEGGTEGQKAPGSNTSGESGDKNQTEGPKEPIDGNSSPGDVFEEVLKQRDKDLAENSSDQKSDSPGELEASTGEGQPGQRKSGTGETEPGQDGAEDQSGQPASPQDVESAAKPSGQGDEASQPGQEQTDTQASPKAGRNDNQGDKPEGDQTGAEGGSQGPKEDDAANEPTGDGQGGSQPDGQSDPGEKRPGDLRHGEEGMENPSGDAEKDPEKSDSAGGSEDDGGDRAGGGDEGKGQDSDQPGLGNPGSNSAADEGGDPSDQQGEGITDPSASGQTKSDRPTGQSKPKDEGEVGRSGEAGGGQSSEAPPDGQQKTDQPSEQQPSPSGDAGQADEAKSDASGSSSSRSAKPSGGGGMPSGSDGADRPAEPPEPQGSDGSAPVEEFAAEAVDLSLEYLEDQLARQEPKQELLDRLGWTRDDLENFVRQWKKMRDAAGQPGTGGQAARKEYDAAVKSLGLRPSGTQLQHGRGTTNTIRKTDSRRFDPPAKWTERSRAYTRSIGKKQ
jgi:collagen type III alpha